MAMLIGGGLFALFSLFTAWVMFWGGNETITGWAGTNILLGLLFVRPLEEMDPGAVRLAVGVWWLCGAVGFGIWVLVVALLSS
jgi:hypothetical protein